MGAVLPPHLSPFSNSRLDQTYIPPEERARLDPEYKLNTVNDDEFKEEEEEEEVKDDEVENGEEIKVAESEEAEDVKLDSDMDAEPEDLHETAGVDEENERTRLQKVIKKT